MLRTIASPDSNSLVFTLIRRGFLPIILMSCIGLADESTARASRGRDVIAVNEVLYDPRGADSGGEFVELINMGLELVPLIDWSLRAGDGAKAGAWKTVWQGSSSDTLHPGGLFLIAGALVEGADAVAELGLQNGPDGCALVLDGLTIDVVGWGDHKHSEYYEGAPAPDVPSGHSLARRPDGRDTDDNSVDLVDCADPSPGRRNALERDLTFGAVPLEISPINPEAHEPVTVSATVINAGFGAGTPDSFVLALEVGALGEEEPVLKKNIASSLARGDTTVLTTAWEHARDGAVSVEAVILCEGDQDTSDNKASLLIRVGPGPVVVNEIMYDPVGGGEWIELFNRSSSFQSLGAWSLFDRSLTRLTLPERAALGPKDYAVVAQDSSGFLEFFPGADPDSVLGSYGGRWPALNNSDASDGLADAVTLVDHAGLLSDRATYSDRQGGGRGLSLERIRADLVGGRYDNWRPSGGPEGATPGRPNSVRAGPRVGRGLLDLDPKIINRQGGAGNATINYALPFRPSRLTLSVYSLDGREVTRLVERQGGPSKGTVLWDGGGPGGEPLGPGAYVLLLAAAAEDGRFASAKAVLAIK